MGGRLLRCARCTDLRPYTCIYVLITFLASQLQLSQDSSPRPKRESRYVRHQFYEQRCGLRWKMGDIPAAAVILSNLQCWCVAGGAVTRVVAEELMSPQGKTSMPDAAIFSPDLFEFLRQLKRHNNRAWFAKNKSRYHELVVEPALLFINSFAPYLYKLSPFFLEIGRPTRGSLFRIYRDIRFSPDKRPFKTHVGIHFHHASGKDAHAPVFYLHLEPDNCFAAAGIWHPDNRALTRVRSAIVRSEEHTSELQSLRH